MYFWSSFSFLGMNLSCLIKLSSLYHEAKSFRRNCFSFSQEKLCILWDSVVHCHLHKSKSLVPILSQINSIANLPSYLRSIIILFKMIVGVQLSSANSAPNSGNNHHLTIPFEGGMRSFKRQGECVSRNWRYESEPPLKPSPLTCYKQPGTNTITMLMFVESQRVHV